MSQKQYLNSLSTADQSHFASAVHADIERSKLNRDNSLKTTMNASYLTPVYVDEILPGDTLELDIVHLSRLITPITPTMDKMSLDFYAFFVPNRLVFENWQELCGENKTDFWVPSEAAAPVPSLVSPTSVTQQSGKIGDYYNIPVGLDYSIVQPQVMPLRGYALIWNEWFRDQNFQAPLIVKTDSTNDTVDGSLPYDPNAALLRVNKPHDYFSSCLPGPQKGGSSFIPITLGDFLPVVTGSQNLYGTGGFIGGNPTYSATAKVYNNPQIPQGLPVLNSTPANLVGSSYAPMVLGSTNGPNAQQGMSGMNLGSGTVSGGSVLSVIPNNLYADLSWSNAQSASSIAELRTAFQIQRLLERDARSGTRYVSMLKAHFGVEAEDYRLQRPEYLGHISSEIGIHQVPQTSNSTSSSPQGNLAAFSYNVDSGHIITKSFVEHGYVHIFAVARHKKTYSYGLEKMWLRKNRFDFYYPVLRDISEQPVMATEIYAIGNVDMSQVWGYNEAWADYRYKSNRLTGQMRNNITNTLNIWHYGDVYNSGPLLSGDWVTDNSYENLQRTLAVQDTDQIYLDIFFKVNHTRPMPVNSIPGFVDHF